MFVLLVGMLPACSPTTTSEGLRRAQASVAPTATTAAAGGESTLRATTDPAPDESSVAKTPAAQGHDSTVGASASSTASATGKPRAVLDEDEFDFGTMEPLERRQHTFTIRNVGDAPLEIEEGTTSCKCTLGEVSDGAIPPGGEGTVTLSWRIGSDKKFFAHEAEILTNDPENPVLVVRVRGEISMRLVADPAKFALPSVVPGQAASSSVVLSSQVWKDFQVRDFKTSLEGLTWDVEPVDPSTTQRLGFACGHRITIHLPDNLPRGYFSHWLRFNVQPEGESPRLREIPIEGKVLRRLAIYGDGIDSTGTIKLPKVRQGKGLTKYFVVKVRDPDPILKVSKVTTVPDFLEVQFEPNSKFKKPGAYRMRLEIPSTAPRSVHMGDPGQLHVEFDHPRLEDIDLKVEFAVLGPSDF